MLLELCDLVFRGDWYESFVTLCPQVHLCEAEGLLEFLGEGAPLPEMDDRPVLVAVKQLRPDATSTARSVRLWLILLL